MRPACVVVVVPWRTPCASIPRWFRAHAHTFQELLDWDVRIQVALNLTLREDVLIAKVCAERRSGGDIDCDSGRV